VVYGTVFVSFCRYLIPHNFKSRHYDASGREVITKVGVPMLIYIYNPLGGYHLGITELFPLIIAPCQVLRWSDLLHNLASPVAMGHATRKV